MIHKTDKETQHAGKHEQEKKGMAQGNSDNCHIYKIFIRDLILEARIGIYPHERLTPQRITINLQLDTWCPPVDDDDHSRIVCYENIVEKTRALVTRTHINLLETLAERIAASCLEDRRVLRGVVRVEKPDIFHDCASVGIEIERHRTMDTP